MLREIVDKLCGHVRVEFDVGRGQQVPGHRQVFNGFLVRFAHIERDRLPLSSALREIAGASAHDCALAGGDDYVLAFTLPPEALAPLAGLGLVEVHTIGRVLEGQGVTLRDVQGRDITPVQRGYQHFRETP